MLHSRNMWYNSFMTRRVRFLAVSDPRGDLELLTRTVDFARTSGAEAAFFLGNLAGPLLEGRDLLELQSARLALVQELDVFRDRGLHTPWDLARWMKKHPGRSRGDAVRVFERLLDGVAADRARQFYRAMSGIFAEAALPCFAMADTCFFEDSVPPKHWLHFTTIPLGGARVCALGTPELLDRDALPDVSAGPRRGGEIARVDALPLRDADVVLAYEIGPDLNEALGCTRDKVVILCQPAAEVEGHVISPQPARAACVYELADGAVERTAYEFAGGSFRPAGAPGESTTTILRRRKRRAEMETSFRVAGLGRDLVQLLELLRLESPQLAARLERADNRAEVLFEYVRHLEDDRKRLKDFLSAERAGMERIVRVILPLVGEAPRSMLLEALATRPNLRAEVDSLDSANVRIAAILEQALPTRP